MSAFAASRRIIAALPALLATVLALTMFTAAPADAHRTERATKIHNAVQVAVAQKGDPYAWGYAGPDRFDCSGLLMYSFQRAGLSLPRTTSAQYGALRHIPQSQMRRGDLMFFHSGGNIYHAAMFLGRNNGQVWLLHASRSGTPVKRDPLWTSSWYGATLRQN